MGIAFLEDSILHVFIVRGEIAPSKPKINNRTCYWALSAMLALSEEELEQYPITCWKLLEDMRPAVEKIFESKGAVFEFLTKDTAMNRVEDTLLGKEKTLNPKPSID